MKLETGKYYSQWGFGVSLIMYPHSMWSLIIDIGPYYIDLYHNNPGNGHNLESFDEFYKDIDDDFGPAPDCTNCGKESKTWDDLMFYTAPGEEWVPLCKSCIDEKNKSNEESEANT